MRSLEVVPDKVPVKFDSQQISIEKVCLIVFVERTKTFTVAIKAVLKS